MSLLMIHEAYMPVYIGSRFSLRTGARAGPPEVVQEALADLKNISFLLGMSLVLEGDLQMVMMMPIRKCTVRAL